jgi:hypothetical protein
VDLKECNLLHLRAYAYNRDLQHNNRRCIYWQK